MERPTAESSQARTRTHTMGSTATGEKTELAMPAGEELLTLTRQP